MMALRIRFDRLHWGIALPLRLLGLFVLGYLLWIVLLYFMQDQMVFPGWKMRKDGDSVPRPTYAEPLWIEPAPGVRVEAWFMPGVGRSAESPGPLLVFAHGNAELIDDFPAFLNPYREWGYSLLAIEYRGFGRSGGRPTEQGIVADAVAFVKLAMQRPEVDPGRIVYHGRSIGGTVLALLALRHTPAALILESSPASILAMARRYGAPGFLVRSPLRADEAVARISTPVLILHGRDDEIVPVAHSQTLADRAGARGERVLLPGGHNDFPRDPQVYWDTIQDFLNRKAPPSLPVNDQID